MEPESHHDCKGRSQIKKWLPWVWHQVHNTKLDRTVPHLLRPNTHILTNEIFRKHQKIICWGFCLVAALRNEMSSSPNYKTTTFQTYGGLQFPIDNRSAFFRIFMEWQDKDVKNWKLWIVNNILADTTMHGPPFWVMPRFLQVMKAPVYGFVHKPSQHILRLQANPEKPQPEVILSK